MTCVFRIAAGPRIGFGHLMRAKALAQCLGARTSVSVRGGGAAKSAARTIGRVVDGVDVLRSADLLVLDDPSRLHGDPWIARARRLGLCTVSIHDERWAHDADLVIAPGLGAPRPRTHVPLLRGPSFYLLDRRTADRRRRQSRRLRQQPRVVIALGGGDHIRQLAQHLVDNILVRQPDVEIEVAAGFAGGRRPALTGATWLPTGTDLLGHLRQADVVVVAGGVTLYEACALGVPAVGLAVVSAQRRAIRAFARQKAVLDAGGTGADFKAVTRAAIDTTRLLNDERLRTQLAAQGRRLVDGRGAERVARRIRQLVKASGGRG